MGDGQHAKRLSVKASVNSIVSVGLRLGANAARLTIGRDPNAAHL
jgi:hypothetical protein